MGIGEKLPRGIGERLDRSEVRHIIPLEHPDLQGRAVDIEFLHLRTGHRLDNPVDVSGHTVRMRPERDVDLLRLDKLRHESGRSSDQRTEFFGLGLTQLGNSKDVPPRLHDERADAQRSDRVFDTPMRGLFDQAAWQMALPAGEVTR